MQNSKHGATLNILDGASPHRKMFRDIYSEMRQRNLENIKQNGLVFDKILRSKKRDSRRSLALFAFFDNHISSNLKTALTHAKQIFGKHIIYAPTVSNFNQGLLHFTFIQLLKTGAVSSHHTNQIVHYVPLLEDALFSMGDLKVNYEGLIALPGNVVLTGIPSKDLNYYREKLRSSINKYKLPFEEPYKSDTAHSTFVRFSKKESHKKVIDFAHLYHKTKFKTLTIKKIFLGYGTWRMHPKETEMLYEFDLISKKTRKIS